MLFTSPRAGDTTNWPTPSYDPLSRPLATDKIDGLGDGSAHACLTVRRGWDKGWVAPTPAGPQRITLTVKPATTLEDALLGLP